MKIGIPLFGVLFAMALLMSSGCCKVPALVMHGMDSLGGSESAQELCPVMNNEINEEYSVVHDGSQIYFCCEPCISTFEEDPDRYLASSDGRPGPGVALSCH